MFIMLEKKGVDAVVVPNRVLFTLFGRDFYWYGLLIAAGVFCAVLLASHLAKKRAVSSDTILDLSLVVMPSALVGARLYFVIFQWDYYAADWVRVFYVWEGGLAVYGGIIAGVLAGFIFCRVKKLNFLALADIAAPAIALGQAIGRWGNFFNQEAYGAAVSNPSLQFFPFAVYIESMANSAEGPWHLAAFFYESLWCALLTLFLVWLFKHDKKPGMVLYAYAALYGLERAVVEGFRTDSLMWGPVRVSQILSIALVIIFGGLLLRDYLSTRTPAVEEDASLKLFHGPREDEDDAPDGNHDAPDGGDLSNNGEDGGAEDNAPEGEE